MPLKLKIRRRLTAKSERVKSVELHPSEPWMLASLYSGRTYIWNIESKKVIKTFTVSDLPVRVAKFVPRKNWIVTGADDTFIRVYNYNNLEKVAEFSAHLDYIRSIAVHPTRPFILSTGDDGIISLWDWKKKWARTQVYKGHTYLVMQVVFNPKDNNQFASASLDRTVKVWQFGSQGPNFSLKHEKDVNCVDYHPLGDKPYLMSGTDGGIVKIWDYQTKSCVQSIQAHSNDVNSVIFHPTLPIILTGASDNTVKIYHASTYRLENSLNYGLERVWTIACQKGSNYVAIGFDEGSMIVKLGQEEPAISMDSSGKIIWAKHSEIQQANIKAMGDQEIKDGERLSLAVKDMGSCEIYPQTIAHSPNGRFAAICGDGEYIIYTAMALRNKSFGSAQEFVWSNDSSVYAVREGNTLVKIFKNFKQHKTLKIASGAEGITGGHLLGVKTNSSLTFYDWESCSLIRRIEITPRHVFWSDNGQLVCIGTQDSFFILKYNPEAEATGEEATEDGIEDAFEVLNSIEESLSTGLWVGDCFIYTTKVNRLKYYVGGEIVTIAHLDRTMYLLGYIPKENRLYLGDKELTIVSYSLLLSVLEYQTAVMRHDFEAADKVLPSVPQNQRARIALFLEKQGFKKQALAITTDPEHKFELALELNDLKMAYNLAKQCDVAEKWKQLSELAMKQSEFGVVQECMKRAEDFGGLMLLASSAGNRELMASLAQKSASADKNNIAFISNFILGRCEECLEILIKTKRLPEAAFFARTYLPSQISRVVSLWKDLTARDNKRISDALAEPSQYENLFPGLADMLKTEQFLSGERKVVKPATAYSRKSRERFPIEEMQLAEASGDFVYLLSTQEEEEQKDDEFVKAQNTPEISLPTLLEPNRSAGKKISSGQTQSASPSSNRTTKMPYEKNATTLECQKQSKPSPAENVTSEMHSTEHSASQNKDATDDNTEFICVEELAKELEEDLKDVNLDDFEMVDLDLDSELLLSD